MDLWMPCTDKNQTAKAALCHVCWDLPASPPGKPEQTHLALQVFDKKMQQRFSGVLRWSVAFWSQPAVAQVLGPPRQPPAEALTCNKSGGNPWGTGPHPADGLHFEQPWSGQGSLPRKLRSTSMPGVHT